MRLIDAEALKSYIDCGHLRPPTETCFSELDVFRMLDKQPAIDAEPVVRCKDCIHYREGKTIPGVKFCYRLKGKDGKTPVGYNFSPDDFCSRGMKKDGGAE